MYIDPHVHCRDGNQAYKETIRHALEVAEKAGVDAIFDMPNINPPIINRKSVEARLKLADSHNSKVCYGLYVGLISDVEQIRDAIKIHREYFPRVVGLKMFAGHSVGNLGIIGEDEQRKVYQTLSEEGYEGVLAVHCEKESSLKPELWNSNSPITHCLARPPESETDSIRDQLGFAYDYCFQGNLHICHISCPESVDLINKFKNNEVTNLKITCGATPHHLFFYDEMMNSPNGIFLKMNPPLRAKGKQEGLLGCLKQGKINFIETDHAPHTKKDKLEEHVSGTPWLDKWPEIADKLRQNNFNDAQIEDLTFNNALNIFKLNYYIKKRNNSGQGGLNEYETGLQII